MGFLGLRQVLQEGRTAIRSQEQSIKIQQAYRYPRELKVGNGFASSKPSPVVHFLTMEEYRFSSHANVIPVLCFNAYHHALIASRVL